MYDAIRSGSAQFRPLLSRAATSFAAFAMLCGCHADLAKRITLNPNGTATVQYRETIDNELLGDIAALGGSDQARLASAKAGGWHVTGPIKTADTFAFRLEKTVPLRDLGALRLTAANGGFNFGPGDALNTELTFGVDDHDSDKRTLVPALLHPSAVTGDGADPNPFTRRANAIRNAMLVDTVVDVHLEIISSGRVLRTNGVMMQGGLARWDLHFATPTDVEYVTQVGKARLRLTASSQDDQIGKTGGFSPLATWRNIGRYGKFDLERWNQPHCHVNAKLHKATMFGVGVYMRGANIPEETMDTMLTEVETWLDQHPEKCEGLRSA